jgi:hypothetical protein
MRYREVAPLRELAVRASSHNNAGSIGRARKAAMLPAPTVLSRHWLTAALASVLAACGTYAPQRDATPALEQRVLELEDRGQRLEADSLVETPLPGPAGIQAQISALEAERARLLTRYYAQHPAIRVIDRRLDLLRGQLPP